MNKLSKRAVGFALMLTMLMEVSSGFTANAATVLDYFLNPAEQLELSVPEKLQDGKDYFFIREDMFTASEKSSDKMYIPIQRTNTEEEGGVTLKVVDMSAHHDVNYTIELYKDDTEPEILYDDVSLVDLLQNAESTSNFDVADENEVGEIMEKTGGATMVDSEGGEVAKITASRYDENGNLILDEETAAKAYAQEEAVMAWQEEADGTSDLAALRAARDAQTGTVSDSREMTGGDRFMPLMKTDAAQDEADIIADDYPGKEYLLHFDAGEDAKYIVITPKYSDAADGDSTILLMLKNAQNGAIIPNEFNNRPVVITDEDEKETVVISMADDTVYAENGKATIHITREGSVNSVAAVTIQSWDGTAKKKDEYSEIKAKVYFPMGVRERIVEIPVWHGEEEKDFYVTITPNGSEVVPENTTRVVLPTAASEKARKAQEEGQPTDIEDDEIAELAESAEELDEEWLGPQWKLFDRYKHNGGYRVDSFSENDGYEFGRYYMETQFDKQKNDNGAKTWVDVRCADSYQENSYAYDGIVVDFDLHTNWANGLFGAYMTDENNKLKEMWAKKFGDVSTADGNRAVCYYGQKTSPEHVQLLIQNYGNRFSAFRNCRVVSYISAVYPIKREFTIVLDNADALSYEGMTSEEVLSQYESAILQDSLQNSMKIKTSDNFSVTAMGTPEIAKMTKLVAYSGNETLEIGVSDGKSRTITTDLTEEIIDKLANKNMIQWNSASNGKMTGVIHIKPVFDYYKEVEVKAAEDEYGVLTYNGGKELKGTKKFHYGDKLKFEMPEKTVPGIRATGVEYKAYNGDRANNAALDNLYRFTDRKLENDVTLLYDYNDFSQNYTDDENMVRVRVSSKELEYFDTTKGLFKGQTGTEMNGYTYYVIRPDVLTGEFVELDAVPKDLDNHVPVWSVPDETSKYSGMAFYFYARNSSGKNEITLSASTSPSANAKYNINGTVTSATYNLRTGHNANDIYPIKGAGVNAGLSSAVSDDDGRFNIPDVYLAGGTTLRYAVSYNGNVELRDIKLAPAYLGTDELNIPASAGQINMGSYSHTGVHISGMNVQLGGFNTDIADIIEMNGQKLTVKLLIDNNTKYIGYDDNGNAVEKTEAVKDVCLYFQNSVTGELHGTWYLGSEGMTWDADNGVATLTIQKFTPDDPEIYTYGDVLMAQIWTDKKVGINSLTGEDMEYAPVSTGYSVITMPGYEPPVLDYSIPDFADMFQIKNDKVDADGMPTEIDGEAYQSNKDLHDMEENPEAYADLEEDSEGGDGETRYTFGQFPYLGAVSGGFNFVVKLASTKLSRQGKMIMAALSTNPELYAVEPGYSNSEGLHEGDNAVRRKVKWDIFFLSEETPWRGVRFMLGVVFSYGNGLTKASQEGQNAYNRMTNPFVNAGACIERYASIFSSGGGASATGGNLIHNSRSWGDDKNAWQAICSTGGPYFIISIYAGIYLDFGYVEITKKVNGTDKTEISHEMIFMGAGGFLGANGTVGLSIQAATWYFVIEGNVDARIFLGSNANPEKTLETMRNSNGEVMKGQDFGFNFEFQGTISAGVTLGLGIYRVLGARGTGGLAFEFGYGKNMAKWFPDIGTNWGYSLDWTLSGALDLIVTSVELFQFSWPTGVEGGWLSYFMRARQANLLITFINLGINKGRGTEEARRYCREKADELAELVDSNKGNKETLLALIKPLKDYARKNGIITWTQWSRVNMNKQAGIIGSLLTAKDTDNFGVLNEDAEEEYISDAEMNTELSEAMGEVRTLRVPDHVDSKWVAGENAELQAAYSPVHTETIMEDAIQTPASEIMALGDNKFLMVFLGDDTSRERQMKSALMWTVYDASNDTWTVPQKLQDDGTADGKPHLCDAGGKVVVSWSSIAPDKYTALKNDIKAELAEANGIEPDDDEIQSELEANPTRVLMNMDVFSVEFDKDEKSFGKIEQLTDDNYYDNYPQAVYDENTGDYIVLYTKTSQSGGKYANEEDRINDLMHPSPNPEKTYSVLCYMLHNNRTDILDTKGETHEAGWARDYYFPNETARTVEQQEEDLVTWKGQRFLQTTVKTDSGTLMTDPAIADLTTANGFNGLAAMAFTVDGDFNANTLEDKEIYVKYYNFADHRPYVAIKAAGDVTVNGVTSQVRVALPKLIRNGGSTWLFWHEEGNELKYLNLSEMLNQKVLVSKDADPEDPDNWIYVLKSDGTFAADPETGKIYKPQAKTVNFESELNDGRMKFTEYRVMSDKDDNLYVIWTDCVNYDRDIEGQTVRAQAQEIYASAMVKEDTTNTFLDDNGKEASEKASSAAWSHPYRLTKDNKRNDGLAVALDENGGLVIVHNEYEELLCDSFEKFKTLVKEGKAGIAETESGDHYIMGSLMYNSPISMKLTRFDEVGSLEATGFEFTHNHPVAGEKVGVTAYIENTGTTSAYGIDAEFYEYKNGKRGKLLSSVKNDKMFPVNSVVSAEFAWEVPEEGAEDYQIQAVIKEKDKDGNWYDAITTYSDKFVLEPNYSIKIDKCEQNGDVFDLAYSVTNIGNEDYADGTKAELELVGLYGDIKEKYGLDEHTIVSEDVSGLKPRETKTIEKSISLPVSVFRYCGYDAVTASVVSANGDILDKTEQTYIMMDKPINLELSGGSNMEIKTGETKAADLKYDSTVFIDVSGNTVYSIADPDIAAVDAEGNVTGLSAGTTTLTAAVMPSGVSESVEVKVTDAKKKSSGGGGGSTSSKVNIYNSGTSKNGKIEASKTNPAKGETVTLTVTPNEGYEVDKVTVTDSKGNEIDVTKNADGTYSFVQPDGNVTVKAEYKKADGSEIGSGDNTWWFKDVPESAWYYAPIKDAYNNKRMSGMSEDYFEPETDITRGMFAYAIYNREGLPETDAADKFADVKADSYFEKAIAWAAENKIVAGYDDTHYGPDDSITREQMAAILWRYAKFKGYDVSFGEDTNIFDFTDASDISEYAVPAIQWAVGDGVITGFEDNTMRPKANANRAQMAVILNKLADVLD